MKKIRIAVALLGITLLASAPAAEAEGFEYSLTPYLWATGLDGTVTILDVTADLDVGFSDLVDNLEMAVPIHFEAKGPVWTLIAEVNFVSLTQDTAAIAGEVDVDMLLAELISAWQWRPTVELFFGARYVEQDITLIVPRVGSPGIDQSWVDPLVGFRYGGQLNRRGTWHSSFRADVAGFGLGSELTWNVRLGLGYDFSESVAVMFGYHWMDTDYEVRGYTYDVLQQGPEVGLKFTF